MQNFTIKPLIAAIFTVMLGASSLSGCASSGNEGLSVLNNADQTNISKQESSQAAEHARLFYKTMLGELEYVDSNFNDAYFMILNAARQSHENKLYERAIQIAIRAGADDSALKAAKEWQKDKPDSMDSHRYTLDILLKLKQYNKIDEPVKKIIQLTPDEERMAFIVGMGHYLSPHARDVEPHFENMLSPWLNGQNAEEAMASRLSLSVIKMAIDKPEEAIEEIQKAHNVNPDSDEPFLAAINLLEHNVPKANEMVRNYLKSPSATPEVRLVYTQFLLKKQMLNEAKTQLEIAIQSPKTPAIAWFILGSLQLDAKQLESGMKNLLTYLEKTKADTSAETKNNQERAYLELAQAETDSGSPEKAQKWIDEINDPEIRVPAQKTYIGILVRAGKYEEALAAVKKLPSNNSEDEVHNVLLETDILIQQNKLQQALSILNKANTKTARKNEDLLYQQAVVADKLKDPAQMERLLREIISLNPNHADAYNALGYSLADRNVQLEEAHQLITKASTLKPDNALIEDSLGWVEFRLGNLDTALQLLEKAYAKFPDSEVAAHLAEVQWSLDLKDEALSTLKLAVLSDPQNNVLQKTMLRLNITQKMLDDLTIPPHVLDQMRNAPKSDNGSENAGAYLNHLIQTNQWQQIYDLLAPIVAKTADPALLQLQAYAADKTDRLDEAEALLRQIMDIDPTNASAYNDLGYILANRNIRLEEAKALVEKAYELMPDSAAITDSMGWIEFRLGNIEQAIIYLQKAYEMDPEIAENGVHLGEALWVSGKQGEAILVWKEVNKKHPNSPELKATLERLGAKLP